MKTNKTTLALLIAGCFGPGIALAEEETKVLSPVVVTATRTEQDSFDLPMSIDKVEKEQIQDGQVRMTLSESLIRVPGITAQNRNSMSSDPQISSRGFGARSTFGVRGVRVYVDGIPLSMPDGIGNPGNVDLGSIAGIEVMRGPFSAMYGNSSGGVIQLFSNKPSATPEIEGDVYFGSFNTRRESVGASGTKDGVEYLLNYSDYSSDGYRDYSSNTKKQATAKIGLQISDDSKLTGLFNWIDQFAQDPGGLTESELSNPRQASANNQNIAKARVYRDHTQAGFNFEKLVDQNNTLNVVAYGGQRNNLGYIFSDVYYTIGTPGSGYRTRASKIDRTFYGFETRWNNRGQLLEKPYSVTFGLNYGRMEDTRTDTSVQSVNNLPDTLRLNQLQTVSNFDQFAQGMWSVAERVDLHAGVRRTTLDLDVKDRIGSNSGALSFEKTLPVAGITFKATPTWNLYANFGKGFETPTLIEISYSSNTGSGPNLNLKPSTSTNYEIGSKWLVSENSAFNIAAFDISTENEIVIGTSDSTSGYTTYKNAGKTKRTGAEASYTVKLPHNLDLYFAYTLLDAEFDSRFTYTSISSTGTRTRTVNAGNQIPGTYRSQIYAEAAWRYQPLGFVSAIEARYNSEVATIDYTPTVTTQTSIPAYTIFNLRASFQQTLNKWKVTEYARIENIFDKPYVGSVRVNDGSLRFNEPAPGRNYIVGVKANYMF